ncbi:AAA family ATPase [Streptomyces sp. SID724]|uniref:AAA family ATPase n=1 Tax=Streptomyces sp. SID724 TaxID=2690324 RepID=UPI001360BCEF|nr:AAA family ATPase [Streptomyces sp. SID724]
MKTIDPKQLPTSFKLSEARKADPGEHPRLLDGFLYMGLMVLYSEPGLGKSMLAGQVEEHLAYGRPFGHWTPERPVNCLVVDLEGDMRLAAERSLTITAFGLLPSDHDRAMAADIEYETEWRGVTFIERLAVLDERLTAAAKAGSPYGYVRIDTLRLFLGAKPHGANAYEWDAFCLGKLNQLALRHDVALVLVHHTNKAGEVSGSTGVAGSATVVAQIRRNPDNEDECLLASVKVRVDAPFRYALAMDDRGRWEFTEEITPTEAELGGSKRAVVSVLTHRGPQVLQDLKEILVDIKPNTVKWALGQLKRDGIAIYRRGQWQLTAETLNFHPKCQICDQPMEQYESGQSAHPTCTPDPFIEQTVTRFLGIPSVPAQILPAPAAAEDERPAGHPQHQEDERQEDEQDHPEVAKFPAFAELRASIEASRMKPLANVPKIERDGLPWSLITERMDGAHRVRSWKGRLPESAELVIVLDRNGSYPSAMSSVPVAPNKLKHTGELGADPLARKPLAGLFQIMIPEWDSTKIPHPLGRIAEGPADEPVWITGSHMELLDRLAADGRMPVVKVLDSWTGRRNASLFERFYKWTRVVREQTAQADEETRTAAKRSISTAIRSLHPKQARSPFYRPDWHKAVVAEASVRHWVMADRAVQGGAVLLSIGAVDEVAFAVPEDAPAKNLWVPTPYRLGGGFGQVKHKEIKVGDDVFTSPVTVQQWQGRGRRG